MVVDFLEWALMMGNAGYEYWAMISSPDQADHDSKKGLLRKRRSRKWVMAKMYLAFPDSHPLTKARRPEVFLLSRPSLSLSILSERRMRMLSPPVVKN
jgi:hypothetical protein